MFRENTSQRLYVEIKMLNVMAVQTHFWFVVYCSAASWGLVCVHIIPASDACREVKQQ